jgi:hypothetical protein
VGLYNVLVYLGTKPLILQIQRSWFWSIWSPKTKSEDKAVNSFQLNSKRLKEKKFRTSRTKPGWFGPAVRTTACPVRRTAGVARPSSEQQAQQRAPSFLFLFFPDACDPLVRASSTSNEYWTRTRSGTGFDPDFFRPKLVAICSEFLSYKYPTSPSIFSF